MGDLIQWKKQQNIQTPKMHQIHNMLRGGTYAVFLPLISHVRIQGILKNKAHCWVLTTVCHVIPALQRWGRRSELSLQNRLLWHIQSLLPWQAVETVKWTCSLNCKAKSYWQQKAKSQTSLFSPVLRNLKLLLSCMAKKNREATKLVLQYSHFYLFLWKVSFITFKFAQFRNVFSS